MFRQLRRRWSAYRLNDPEYRFLFEDPGDDDVVSIDCETTGLDPRKDEIISIAAIKIRGSLILTSQRFEAVVRPA